MSDTLDIIEKPEIQERPTFLTVLCILTFIGAGIGVLSGIWGAITINSTIATLESSKDVFGNLGSEFGDVMNNQAEALKKWGLITQLLSILGNGLCLLGALWMWNLKKNGFFFYVIGQIIPLVATFGFMGTAGLGMFAGFAILGAIFPIGFIIMYAINFKYLTK